MANDSRTEYGIRSTTLRHGKRAVTVETFPGHETDQAWHEQYAEQERDWQKQVGIAPDAEVVSRTITVTDWTAA